ncbi:MAG TPA: NAD+ synthase [Acidobacteriota bacterium]|nr:NAD+ synthase [Acidobacteriota bacterium]HNT18396.1 NAD+ synthase [Acidobacteriota bacterium]
MKKQVYPPPLDIETALTIIDRFLVSEMRKAGRKRLVVGMSGGVDSALSAALAVRALGKENLVAVKMPYKSSSPLSEKHAGLMIDKLCVESVRVDITPMVDGYFEREGKPPLSPFAKGGELQDNVRRGNFMARMRMAVLYDLSAKLDALVLGTGNRSEWLLGYTTLYGDSACALNPIGGLYKTQVYQLAAFAGVPEEIISKPPSADLWPGQNDEGDMGLLYSDADAVFYLSVDEGRAPREVSDILGMPFQKVENILKRMENMEFKRRLPPVAAMPSPQGKNED